MGDAEKIVRRNNELSEAVDELKEKLEQEKELRKKIQSDVRSDFAVKAEADVEMERIRAHKEICSKAIIVGGIVLIGLSYGINILGIITQVFH